MYTAERVWIFHFNVRIAFWTLQRQIKKYLVFPCTCTGVDLSGILWILFQITVVNLADENQELDMLILTSILKSKYQHLSMVFLFAV